ncbi:hypothetical protein LXL04_002328 [Taraxacum kok-saghyz]
MSLSFAYISDLFHRSRAIPPVIAIEAVENSEKKSPRKRPARIQIPFAPLSITEEISKPNDEVAEIDEEGEEYSVYCKRGKRGSMEDRYSAVVDLQGDTKQLERITNLQIICVIKHKTTVSEYEVTEAVREGYLATDSEFLNEDINGGTCCVTALIRKGNLIVSNAGDCRAVMSRGGVAEALTVDHKPSRNDEKDRIEPMVRTYNDFDPKLLQIRFGIIYIKHVFRVWIISLYHILCISNFYDRCISNFTFE